MRAVIVQPFLTNKNGGKLDGRQQSNISGQNR